MKLKLLAPLLFLASQLLAQNNFQAIIADSNSKQPLAFVNIGVVNKNIGTVSDLDGFFSLKLNPTEKEDLIRFSMIGYKSYTENIASFVKKFSKGDTVFLKEEVLELSEIVLSENKWKRKTLGNKTKSKSISTGFTNNELGNEIGVIIPIKDAPTVLETFFFHINENQYRPLVFRGLKEGLPHKSLVYENIIVKTSIKSGMMSIDLRPYNICCLLYTSPSPRDGLLSRMPSSA